MQNDYLERLVSFMIVYLNVVSAISCRNSTYYFLHAETASGKSNISNRVG